ncbi:MAG: hypothetical protein ACI9LY_004061 [Arenicella sp.]|jgi:hypothetical protein|tara:strand:+ start:307 stop:507 length:201 start_codon:yes stop_codon:yes gene_type:complete
MIRDQDLEFFRPVWRRYAVTTVCLLWALFEWLIAGSPFWGMLTGAMAIYCYYRLFYTFELPEEPEK